MKKLGDLMNELGFNPQASQGAKEAFIKNLVRDAYGVELATPTERKKEVEKKSTVEGSQLSFDLRDLVPADEVWERSRRRTGTR